VDISSPREIDESQAVELLQIEGEPFTCEEGFTGFPNIAFSPDGRSLATVSIKDRKVTFWDTLTGQSLHQLSWDEEAGPVYGVVLSPTWKTLAWVSRSLVQLMDIETGKPGSILRHQDFVSSAAFSPDGLLLATASIASVDGKPAPVVLLWEAAGGKEQRELIGPPAGASVLSFSPPGDTLVWGAWNGQVHLWNLLNPDSASQVGNGVHSDAISSVTFSPDQNYIASAGRDNSVKIFRNPKLLANEPEGREEGEFLALPGERAAFSPDGRLVAVALDGIVSLWGILP
jgi:WD40 repeat protein